MRDYNGSLGDVTRIVVHLLCVTRMESIDGVTIMVVHLLCMTIMVVY